MRVLLVVPTYRYQYEYPAFVSNSDFPIGIAYLASALQKAGHEVAGLNLNNIPGYASAQEMLRDRLSRALKEHKPQLVGLGGLCTDYAFLKDAIGIVRTTAPDVPIVSGGGLVTNDPAFALETLRPDFCIIGEAEEILVQLVETINAGTRDYEQIPNLGFWRDGAPVFTREDFQYPDINSRAFPDYEPFGIHDLLDNYGMAARYLFRFSRPNPRPMTLITARGCPFKCTFCVHRRGPKYRARSTENVMREIGELYARYHFNILVISDELFAVTKNDLRRFCAAIEEGKKAYGWDFDWLFQTHASANLEVEELKMAKDAGCYFFCYGMESASPRVLASMNKRTRPLQFEQAIERARSAGIGYGGNFIFGDVVENGSTIAETMRFFLQHCLDVHLNLFAIRPYPGSELFDSCIKNGLIPDRARFYEHIDDRRVNMTAMPRALWLLLINGVTFIGIVLPWVKSTGALSCVEDAELNASTLAKDSGQTAYRVEAVCPHCGKQVKFYEMLDADTKARLGSNSTRVRGLSRGVMVWPWRKDVFLRGLTNTAKRVARWRVVPFLVQMVLMRRSPFWLLARVKGRGKIARTSFLTGCSQCNRYVRINLTPRVFASGITNGTDAR